MLKMTFINAAWFSSERTPDRFGGHNAPRSINPVLLEKRAWPDRAQPS
jgi:hypothetical protein